MSLLRGGRGPSISGGFGVQLLGFWGGVGWGWGPVVSRVALLSFLSVLPCFPLHMFLVPLSFSSACPVRLVLPCSPARVPSLGIPARIFFFPSFPSPSLPNLSVPGVPAWRCPLRWPLSVLVPSSASSSWPRSSYPACAVRRTSPLAPSPTGPPLALPFLFCPRPLFVEVPSSCYSVVPLLVLSQLRRFCRPLLLYVLVFLSRAGRLPPLFCLA